MLVLVLQHSLLLILILHVLHVLHLLHVLQHLHLLHVLQHLHLLHVLQHLQSYQVCHVIAPSVHINDSILLLADAVDDIEVLDCGIISWKPPPGNELEELEYIVRFFEGSTYADTTGYRRNQSYAVDIGRQSAVAEDLPYGTTVYAQVSVYSQYDIKYFPISIGSCSE